ncbi:MAG TPA: hypothetical protein VJR89_34420 [Polyangiales bacterium]|nr:hypothetical protein [Polyangiales bacterium]
MRLRVCSALVLLLAGCLDHELAPDAEGEPGSSGSSIFIAQQRDFADFEDWMPFEIEVEAEHTSVKGKITEYLSQMPAPNSDRFPVGTMIAKTVETDAGVAPEIHAMAKRGGSFNAKGAQGWEFFELKKDKDGTPVIVWRGAKPPDGERYKNLLDPNATRMEVDCNGCHADTANDAVLSDELSLRHLP